MDQMLAGSVADEHESLRGVTDQPQSDEAAEYRAAVADMRQMMAREHDRGVERGLIVSGPRPRRKRGRDPWCDNDTCPDGHSVWGAGAMAREDEHQVWLDGRRRDARYCSDRCRQAAFRARDRRERDEWWPSLVIWREAIVSESFGNDETRVKPLTRRNWKVWRDIVIDLEERYGETQEEKEEG